MIFIIKSSLLTITLGFFMGCSGISNDTSNIDTLIITSNRHESIALAEHLQVRNEQLVLSIPANKADTTLYILGPEKDLLLETNERTPDAVRYAHAIPTESTSDLDTEIINGYQDISAPCLSPRLPFRPALDSPTVTRGLVDSLVFVFWPLYWTRGLIAPPSFRSALCCALRF